MNEYPDPTGRQRQAEDLLRRRLLERARTVDGGAVLAAAQGCARRRRRVRLAAELLGVAAAVAAGLLFVWFFPVVRAPPGSVTVLGDGREQVTAVPESIALADGSLMRVTANTRYRLKSRMPGQAAVEVESGQAYFEVVGGAVPFVVATPQCSVKAMGTSFMVDASIDDPTGRQGGAGMSVFRQARGAAVVVAVFGGLVELTNPHGGLLLGGGGVAIAQEGAAPVRLEKEMGPGVGLTVYNGNFAVVKERRELDLPKGVGEVRFAGVARTIDATSVHFVSLSDPGGVQVLDQDYEYDLVSPDKILEKYLDQPVTLVLKGSGAERSVTLTGVLQSCAGGSLTLLVDGGVRIIDRGAVQDIKLGALPEGLMTRPTLVWKTQADQGGKHLVKITYLADTINWQADYTAVLDPSDTAVDLNGWVTVTNRSGVRYENAQLKLIAGNVRRIRPPAVRTPEQEILEREVQAIAMQQRAAFEQKPFADYHMYTLPRPTTVNDNQVKQVELIEPALGVPVTRFYECRPSPGRTAVNVKVEFANSKEGRLGIPLPKGTVRLFKKDQADGSLEFVGEDRIDHTPSDEKVTLHIGDAFDIVCETRVTESQSADARGLGRGQDRHWSRASYEVELRNHKKAPVEVRVVVSVGSNYRIEKETIDGKPAEHTEKDAFTLEYRVPVPEGGTSTLSYTVFHSY